MSKKPGAVQLDVHSPRVNACVRIATGRKSTTEHREFAATTAGLFELAEWLTEAGCTHVAMEATGVYWKPVWHVLEDAQSFKLLLANGCTSEKWGGPWQAVPAGLIVASLTVYRLSARRRP